MIKLMGILIIGGLAFIMAKSFLSDVYQDYADYCESIADERRGE